MRDETGAVADNMNGDKLYQQRARTALPLLVRQAHAQQPVYYEDLATELEMSNPRNLNFVLGSVGQSLIELSEQWKDNIPPIQCLVINQTDALPGEGFGWFMPNKEYWRELSKRQKRALVQATFQQIYAYPKWNVVLTALDLKPTAVSFVEYMEAASRFKAVGESEDHRRLKEYVRSHPQVLGIRKARVQGAIEKRLASGDCMDVFFELEQQWIGVEVKSARSNAADIVRGLFQCVKYLAVLRATAAAVQREVEVRAILVLEGKLPAELIALKHILGVEVLEGVLPV